MADPTPTEYRQDRDVPPAIFDVHEVALREIDQIVGNENSLDEDQVVRVRGIILAALTRGGSRD